MKFLVSLLLVALIIAAAAAYLIYAPVGPTANAVFVDIAPGTTAKGIGAQLESAGIIRSRYAFELLRFIRRGRLVAGEYRFDHPAPATEVYARLHRGDVYFVTLTIPEGYNIFDIAQAVAAAGLGDHDRFLAAEQNQTALVADLSPRAPSLEGFLFPDTYKFTRHSTPVQILSSMVRRFRQVSAQLSIAKSGRPLPETVTLASLVEKEVAQDSERPLVAGVFINRLAHNIPLATDPSVIYAALLEHRYHGAIYQSDLKFSSPYNTYLHAGLPPGPICNPGVAALKAAIAPAHTDFLYFVADAQGHSRFSATLKEHTQQVQQYRRALREQH